MLVENDKTISDKIEVATILNNYFVEAVETLEIERFNINNEDVVNDENLDKIDKILKRYHDHPSILKIKEHVKIETKFNFSDTSGDATFSQIRSLDPKKGSMENDIPIKMLKGTNDISCEHLAKLYNDAKNSNNFPTSLKTADVTPIHKGEETNIKKNYRPISLTPIISKLFEKNMYESIFSYIEKFLSPYLFGYRKV